MRTTFTDLLNDPSLLEQRLPKTFDFYKKYTNLTLKSYSRYWALFAFMYDKLENVKSEDEVDSIFQSEYTSFSNKNKDYLDAWKYFAAFKRQELNGKTSGSYIYETITYDFQILMRNEYLKK
jgi:hypothetical protein